MFKVGLLFPGQGSQFPGMGKEVINDMPEATKIMENANNILGFDIGQIILNGDEELLKRTEIAQPAIFIVSAIHLAKLSKKQIRFDIVAGHSLGEYTALYAACSLSFADGLNLVRKRGLLMADTVGLPEGSMAAIMGLDIETIRSIVGNYSQLCVANINSKSQIVVSGPISSIDESLESFIEAGATKVIKLKVSGAFHSCLMNEAAQKLAEIIHITKFSEPKTPIIPNYSAAATADPEIIKECLIKQMTNPVKWLDTIILMKELGVKEVYEVGPGEVLKRLVPTITTKIKCLSY